MNYVMYEGKKAVAENIIYGAFELIEGKRRDQGPLETFHAALENVLPVGGSAFAPGWRGDLSGSRGGSSGTSPRAGDSLAGDRPRASAVENTMTEKLAGELLDASNNRGTAVKKRRGTPTRWPKPTAPSRIYRW